MAGRGQSPNALNNPEKNSSELHRRASLPRSISLSEPVWTHREAKRAWDGTFMGPADARHVCAVRSVDLRVSEGRWVFADAHEAEIDAHWSRRTRETPQFFNGTVHILQDYDLSRDGGFSARFVRSDFKSFLYWREQGFPDASVRDGFGSAILFSAGGKLLAGRQRGGNLNSGLAYPPGGFIDAKDVGADGVIDIETSVLREISEELGLAQADLARRPGFIVTAAGPVVSIGVPFAIRLSDRDLVAAVRRHIAADPNPELDDILFLDPGAPPHDLAMPDYARVLVEDLPLVKTLS